MRRWLAAAAAIAGLAVAGCGGSPAVSHAVQVAACTKVLQARMDKTMSDPSVKPSGEPAQCDGLSARDLKRIAGKIITGEMRKVFGG